MLFQVFDEIVVAQPRLGIIVVYPEIVAISENPVAISASPVREGVFTENEFLCFDNDPDKFTA